MLTFPIINEETSHARDAMEPGDPPDALTVWRKGSASIHILVKGRAAHAGMAPQDGRNAAVELVHQLSALVIHDLSQ